MRPRARPTAPEAAAPHGSFASSACARALADAGLTLDVQLHTGRVADVWLATCSTGERAALKLLRPEWLGHRGAREWLRREHGLLATLAHPAIVRALGFVDGPDCCGVATEHYGCGDLVAVAGARPEIWIDAACDVAAGLDALHARGYVHGDVKARNVLVSAEGRAKLSDFGSALPIGAPLPSAAGVRPGRTAAHEPQRCGYAEVYARRARAETAADAYALAVLLYELMTRRLPFGADEELAPLVPAPAAPASVAALARRVTAALTAADAESVGTLTDWINVLESVRRGRVRNERHDGSRTVYEWNR